MKKVLFIAMLALSVNALAQNKRPASDLSQSALNAIEKIRSRMESGDRRPSGIYSDKIAEQPFSQEPPQDTIIVQIMDSVEIWQWDTLSRGWEPESRIIDMVCNDQGSVTSQLVQNWDGISWEDFLLSTQSLNEYNNRTGSLHQLWNGFEWENILKDSLLYDVNTNLNRHLTQNWNGSAWENTEQEIYSYDESGNPLGSLKQKWNDNQWENFSQISFYHDPGTHPEH